HFAMTLICAGAPVAADIEAALGALTADGSLVATVRKVSQEPETAPAGGHHILTVHGADRLGIVAAVHRPVPEQAGNLTALTPRLAGTRSWLVAEGDLPAGADLAGLRDRLAAVGATLGVEVSLRPADADLL